MGSIWHDFKSHVLQADLRDGTRRPAGDWTAQNSSPPLLFFWDLETQEFRGGSLSIDKSLLVLQFYTVQSLGMHFLIIYEN